jgi:hypothetical protein
MRKRFQITLNQPALAPLRHGCYARLRDDIEELCHALEGTATPEASRHTHAAYTRLVHTAGLLDRIGWTEQDRGEQVTINEHAHLELAVEILRHELEPVALDDGAGQGA